MRILIVDDDPVSRKLLAAIMAGFGECDFASSGEEAVERFRKGWEAWNPFSLVTLDFQMPGLKGTQVLAQIREMEKSHNIGTERKAVVMMVTASADKGTVIDCKNAGCDDYIVKPFNSAVIGRKMASFSFFAQDTGSPAP